MRKTLTMGPTTQSMAEEEQEKESETSSVSTAATGFGIFMLTLIIGVIALGSLGWILAIVASLGYMITKAKA